ncbi:MAG: tetratricopeptide repeat protein [Candidatus Heimdallarchaeota archaeon]|nr:tetratricopeptide repeat protein [Candidatus Heimdallarchaeota archaeon]
MGSSEPSLEEASRLLSIGKYTETLDMLEILNQIEFKTVIEWMSWIIIKARTLNRLDRFEESLSLLSKIKKKQLILLDSRNKCDFFVSHAEANLFLGNLEETKKNINSGEEVILNSSTTEKIEVKECQVILQLIKGSYYFRQGFLKEASTLFLDCVSTSQNLNLILLEALSYNQLGRIHHSSGDLNKALEYYFRGLELKKDLGSLHEISRSYNNIGITYLWMGETKKALDHLQQSLALKENLGNFGDMSNILSNIGNYFFERGELEKAEDYIERSLKIRKKIGESLKLAENYSKIGDVYYSYRNFDKASKNYLKSYELRKASDNNIALSFSLFELINLKVAENDLDSANKYLEELRNINEKEQNLLVDQHFEVSSALICYSSPRLKDKFNALEIFTNFLTKEKTRHFLHIFSLLKVCDLLFFELKVTGDEKILQEVQKYANELIDIANQSKSFPLLAESYLLNSKLALLEFNLKEAQELLALAFSIAEDKGLKNLALRISNEYDILLDQLSQWNNYLTHNASIVDRLELSQLNKIIKRMNKDSEDERTYFEDEEPVLFIIISEYGENIYTKRFESEITIDDALVGGFLTAINKFIQEVFESVGIIERIKHQDYTILMKTQEKLFFCYIIKGKSYIAQNKIKTLLDRLVNNKNLWSIIKTAAISKKSTGVTELSELDDIVVKTLSPRLSEIDIF